MPKEMITDEVMKSLVAHYLAGTTTIEEEARMARYFRESRDVPEEWRAMRDMFAYIDDGMPLGAVPDFDGVDASRLPADHPVTVSARPVIVRRRRLALWLGAGAVAAAAVAAFVLVVQPQRQVTPLPIANAVAPVYSQSAPADTVAADTVKGSPSMFQPSRRNATDRRQRKLRYDMAPPKTYYASAAAVQSDYIVVKDDTASAEALESVIAQYNAILDEQQQLQETIQQAKRLVDESRAMLVATENYADEDY